MDRNLLAKATSSDKSPTPGYLYGEIAKMTMESIVDCEKVTKYLGTRIRKSDANIKLKCLLVIRHVCRRGNASFRRCLQPIMPDIKECLQFRGPNDPLRGDEPNRAVREAAKETMEAIFDRSTEVSGSNSALASRIKGFGNAVPDEPASENSSGAAHSSYTGTSVASGRYASDNRHWDTGSNSNNISSSNGDRGFGSTGGIGNPNFQDPRNKPKTFFDKVKDQVKERIGKEADTNHSAQQQSNEGWMQRGSGTDGYSFANNRSSGNGNGSNSPSRYDPTAGIAASVATMSSSTRDSSAPRLRGQVGGGWGSNAPTSSLQSPSGAQRASLVGSGGGGGGFSPAGQASRGPRSDGRGGSAATDGVYERTLVDELCSKGGVRAVPPADKLRLFVNACKTLAAGVVMEILEEKLVDDAEWKVQHKALCVCEALVKSEAAQHEQYADYIDANPDILEDLLQSKQSSVRDRARRVWCLLYGDDALASEDTVVDTPATATAAVPVNVMAQPEPDLLDLGDDVGGGSSGSGGMFSGLSSGGVGSSDAATHPPLPARAANSSPNAMFSNMTLKDSKSTPPTVPTAVVNNNNNNIIGSLLDGFDSNDFVDTMGNRQQQASKPTPTPAPSASGSSSSTAFSFISSNSAPATAPAPRQLTTTSVEEPSLLDSLNTGAPSLVASTSQNRDVNAIIQNINSVMARPVSVSASGQSGGGMGMGMGGMMNQNGNVQTPMMYGNYSDMQMPTHVYNQHQNKASFMGGASATEGGGSVRGGGMGIGQQQQQQQRQMPPSSSGLSGGMTGGSSSASRSASASLQRSRSAHKDDQFFDFVQDALASAK